MRMIDSLDLYFSIQTNLRSMFTCTCSAIHWCTDIGTQGTVVPNITLRCCVGLSPRIAVEACKDYHESLLNSEHAQMTGM